MTNDKDIDKIGFLFGLKDLLLREDTPIAGSPERTEYRVVVQASNKKLFVIEQVGLQQVERKRLIARVISDLRSAGFDEAIPYLRAVDKNEHVVELDGKYWQSVPFVQGVPLTRPEYVFEHWRGDVMASVLLKLRSASLAVAECSQKDDFSLPLYIDGLVNAINKRRPDISSRINAMHSFVRDRLYGVYKDLPIGFCHGDYHAVNIIWKEKGVGALIDWEFMGVKPELYDAANMISCLGVEDPACLIDGATVLFVHTLKRSGVYGAKSFEYLLDLVIALRFAWISEWLRKKDDEMLLLEFDYFDLLSEHYTQIISSWKSI